MPQAKRKAINIDLHSSLLAFAHRLIKEHLEKDENGEMCFNLGEYLEQLASCLENRFAETRQLNGPLGRFELSGEDVARYLWACIAAAEGGDAYPAKFRGMGVYG